MSGSLLRRNRRSQPSGFRHVIYFVLIISVLYYVYISLPHIWSSHVSKPSIQISSKTETLVNSRINSSANSKKLVRKVDLVDSNDSITAEKFISEADSKVHGAVLIVGGTDGSGTRSVVQTLIDLGVCIFLECT